MTTTPTAPPDSAVTEPRPASRDPWLDNAKMTLVTLVVVGHAWVLLPSSDARDTAYHALYAWHVPAFVMVTGYLSRSFAWTLPRFRLLLLTVAVPYLVFEAAMALFRTVVGGEELDRLFLDPHWPMWYLAALFLWRLVTPVFLRIPHPVVVAVVISLVGGYVGGDVLDLARTTGLLPFFVLGLVARREHLSRIRTPGWRLVGLLGLVGTTVAAWFLHAPLSMELLYWRTTYAGAGFGDVTGPLARGVLLAVAGVTAVGVLALVPRRESWFTALGPATLVVYLFHGFVVKGVGYTPSALAWAGGAPVVALLVVTVAAVALALLLAAPPVARGLNPAIDPLGTIDDLKPRTWADQIPPRLHASATPVEPHFPGQLR